MLGLRLNVIMSCVLVFLLHNVFSPSVKDTSSTSNVSYTVGVHPRLDQGKYIYTYYVIQIK